MPRSAPNTYPTALPKAAPVAPPPSRTSTTEAVNSMADSEITRPKVRDVRRRAVNALREKFMRLCPKNAIAAPLSGQASSGVL